MKRLIVALATAGLALAGCTSSTTGSGDTVSGSAPASTPGGTLTGSPIPASTTVTPPASSAAPSTSVPPVPRSGPLNGFLVADVTFVGKQGWALGTVGCTQSSGRCTALAHTTDNGRTWRSITPPPVHVRIPEPDSGDCGSPCVSSVRFATTAIGYLFGGGAQGGLLITKDGGAHWQPQSGDAVALESLDGNVIRATDNGCDPPGCRYSIQVSRIGGSKWTPATLGGPYGGTTAGALLARSGSHAYLLTLGHTAGGAQDARSTLWTSADDGHHWTNQGEPCPQGKHEVDSTALTTAPDGTVVVLCQDRVTQQKFVALSDDGGADFAPGAKKALGAATAAIGAGSAKDVLASSDDTYRSTDGGRHFSRLGSNGGSSPGPLGWLGFASASVAHGISVDRRTLWLTTDGGLTWHAGQLK